MTGFVSGPVEVVVPATSANLGPGFDSLGISLDITDALVGEIIDVGLSIEVKGEGADEVPLDANHLVYKAMCVVFDELGGRPRGLSLRCFNEIPHSRGLGSSSAAIVGGLLLARAMVEGGADALSLHDVLRMANDIEGHPDNVAPAIFGGLLVCGQSDDEVWAQPAALDPSIDGVVLIPPTKASTAMARNLLPETINHADAAANSARAALLITALGGATEMLWRATEDFLHQDFRAPAMQQSHALVEALRDAGRPAVISGAGPTVLCFNADGEVGARRIMESAPPGWQSRRVALGGPGGRVLR